MYIIHVYNTWYYKPLLYVAYLHKHKLLSIYKLDSIPPLCDEDTHSKNRATSDIKTCRANCKIINYIIYNYEQHNSISP